MGNKDVLEKALLNHADVFAEILNVAVFHGEMIFEPDSLVSTLPRSIYEADKAIYEQERDVVKFWKPGNLCIALLGLENQSDIDDDMPLRIMGYDGAAYRHELHADEDGKPKIRYPVVTFVLYFGYKKRWTKPLRLTDCFDIPEKLRPFVSDYPINVIEVAWLPDETIRMFQSDFKVVADLFHQLRLEHDYRAPTDKLKHAEEVMRLLKTITNNPIFDDLAVQVKGKEEISMMDIWKDLVNPKDREKWMAEGIVKGAMEKTVTFVCNLLKKRKLNYDEIAEAAEISVDEVRRIADKYHLAY